MSDVGGPFSSLVTDKHPSYKKALKKFKKNALIKMYFANEKSATNKDELVREDGSYKLNPFLKDAFNWLEVGAKEGFSPDKFHNLIYNAFHACRADLVKDAYKDWPNFNFVKAEKVIKDFFPASLNGNTAYRYRVEKFKELILSLFPKNMEQSKEELNKIKSTASKLATKKLKITEALQTVKFRYMSARNDPVPVIKVLDTEYPGAEGQKSYGQRKDILGWNLNYFENKVEAKKTIDEIDSFSRILGTDKKEKYERIKMLFPEQAQYLRRYIKDNCKGVKIKEEGLWRPTDWDEIRRLDTQSF